LRVDPAGCRLAAIAKCCMWHAARSKTTLCPLGRRQRCRRARPRAAVREVATNSPKQPLSAVALGLDTTIYLLRSDRSFTLAQRSSSNTYRSSSGRWNRSDDPRLFHSPRLTATDPLTARTGCAGSGTSTMHVEYLQRQVPQTARPALNLSPGNRYVSHFRLAFAAICSILSYPVGLLPVSGLKRPAPE